MRTLFLLFVCVPEAVSSPGLIRAHARSTRLAPSSGEPRVRRARASRAPAEEEGARRRHPGIRARPAPVPHPRGAPPPSPNTAPRPALPPSCPPLRTGEETLQCCVGGAACRRGWCSRRHVRATTGVGGAEIEGSVVDRGSTQGCGGVRPGEGHGYGRRGEGDGEDRGRAAPNGDGLIFCV